MSDVFEGGPDWTHRWERIVAWLEALSVGGLEATQSMLQRGLSRATWVPFFDPQPAQIKLAEWLLAQNDLTPEAIEALRVAVLQNLWTRVRISEARGVSRRLAVHPNLPRPVAEYLAYQAAELPELAALVQRIAGGRLVWGRPILREAMQEYCGVPVQVALLRHAPSELFTEQLARALVRNPETALRGILGDRSVLSRLRGDGLAALLVHAEPSVRLAAIRLAGATGTPHIFAA